MSAALGVGGVDTKTCVAQKVARAPQQKGMVDLAARTMADLCRVAREILPEGCPAGQSKPAMIARLLPHLAVQVVPCLPPRIKLSRRQRILAILESLPWERLTLHSGRQTSRGFSSFVLGATRGALGSSGFEDTHTHTPAARALWLASTWRGSSVTSRAAPWP